MPPPPPIFFLGDETLILAMAVNLHDDLTIILHMLVRQHLN
jgi:hypothetical protein